MHSTHSRKKKSKLSSGTPGSEDINQTRRVGLPTRRSDFDRIEQINPFTRMSSNPAKFDRCVKQVKAKGGVDNPYAVCNASLKGS